MQHKDTRICPQCGSRFDDYPSQTGTFCTRTCYRASVKRPAGFDWFWEKVNKDAPPPVHRPALGNCWLIRGATVQGYVLLKYDGQQIKAHRLAYELANGLIPDTVIGGNGEIGRAYVCHRCDNRRCVRNDGPNSHLFLGTAWDNAQDAKAKGRTTAGSDRVPPERRARGDRSGSRLHPESLPHGDDHWTRQRPGAVLRGDANGMRLHPESVLRGSANGFAKLTEQQVISIRTRLAAGDTLKRIAAEFGVSQTTISYVKAGKYWRHVNPSHT